MSQPPGSGPYPPQGPAPQQPPYGSQPPYGQPPQASYSQPPQSPYGQPPQQPGYGQQQYASPNFAAQQSYGAPGQPGPSPYGPGGPGGTSPGGVPPQLPRKKSHAGLVVGVVAIVLVLIVAGGVALFLNQAKNAVVTAASNMTMVPAASISQAAPQAATSTTATKATTTTAAGGTDVSCSGSTIDSGAYSAKVPSGWQCSSQSGGLMITDKKYDTLLVMDIEQTTDAAAVCSSLATSGTMTALADTQWGGKTAKTAEMASAGTKVHVRCVNANNSVFYLMAVPITGTYDEVVAGVNALTSGWTWK